MQLNKKERKDIWVNAWREYNNTQKGNEWFLKRWWKAYKFAGHMVMYVEYIWLPSNVNKTLEQLKKEGYYNE